MPHASLQGAQGRILGDKPPNPQLYGFEDFGVLQRPGHQDDRNLHALTLQLAENCQSIRIRQPEVHDGQIGAMRQERLQKICSVAAAIDRRRPETAQHLRNPFEHERLCYRQ